MIKIDSCSLIYLIKADLLGLAVRLYRKIRITKKVFQEVVIQGKEAGHSDASIAEAEINRKKIEVVECKMKKPPQLAGLGKGESDTIAEALNEGCPAMLDDIKAKLIARKLKLSYVSVDVMLLEALAKKKITLDEFNEMVRELNRVCSMRSEKYADLLAIAKVIAR